MYSNLRYLEDDSPEGRRTFALYHDAQVKQSKLEQIKIHKVLLEMKEEIELDEARNPPTQRRIEDFYEYNRTWQSMVNQRRLAKCALQSEAARPKYYQRVEDDPHLPQNYVGPVQGWKARVEDHMNKKVNAGVFDQFIKAYQPQLNKNSVAICQQNEAFDGSIVEDRLMKYGVDMKNKKMFKMQSENFNQQLEIEKVYFKPNVSSTINMSLDERPVFDRLYDYANYYEKKKQDHLAQCENDEVHVKEPLSLNPEMEQRVNDKRKIHPLYLPKSTEKSNNIQEQFDKQEKTISKDKFEQFLFRNFDVKQKTSIDAYNKEDDELRECSFVPYINPKSQELLRHIDTDVIQRSNKLLQDKKSDVLKIRNEQDLEEMQECSFKPNTHIDVVREKRNTKLMEQKKENQKNEKLKLDRASRKVIPIQQQKSISPINKPKSKVKVIKSQIGSPVKTNNQAYNLKDILKQPEIQPTIDINNEFTKVEQQISNLYEQFNN